MLKSEDWSIYRFLFEPELRLDLKAIKRWANWEACHTCAIPQLKHNFEELRPSKAECLVFCFIVPEMMRPGRGTFLPILDRPGQSGSDWINSSGANWNTIFWSKNSNKSNSRRISFRQYLMWHIWAQILYLVFIYCIRWCYYYHQSKFIRIFDLCWTGWSERVVQGTCENISQAFASVIFHKAINFAIFRFTGS